MHALSVIIPALNEAQALPKLLADLATQSGLALELIVADGGSSDGTVALARDAGALVVTCPSGRARQMNAGASAASHDWLLFLHADSGLPEPHLLARALAAMRDTPPLSAGHFGLTFADAPDTARAFYRHLERKSRLNRPETINGDQGLLIRRRCLAALGGFDPRLPILEDQALAATIFAQGRWQLLPGSLHTSARRFEAEGRGRRYLLMMLIMCARRAGLEAEFFARARRLYPQQSEARDLRLQPYFKVLAELAGQQPEFWRVMAAYTLDNAWQPVFVLEQALGIPLLNGFDRHARQLPRAHLEPLLARLLELAVMGVLAPLMDATPGPSWLSRTAVFAQRNIFRRAGKAD